MSDIYKLENQVDVLFKEENGSKTMYIQGPFAIAERVDDAGRKFSAELLTREIARYNEECVKRNLGFIELGYPNTPIHHDTLNVDLAKVSSLIVSLTQEGNHWIGKAKILETPAGKVAQNLLESGYKAKVSFYGIGTVQNVDGVSVVQDDYKLIGFSLVPVGIDKSKVKNHD